MAVGRKEKFKKKEAQHKYKVGQWLTAQEHANWLTTSLLDTVY